MSELSLSGFKVSPSLTNPATLNCGLDASCGIGGIPKLVLSVRKACVLYFCIFLLTGLSTVPEAVYLKPEIAVFYFSQNNIFKVLKGLIFRENGVYLPQRRLTVKTKFCLVGAWHTTVDA